GGKDSTYVLYRLVKDLKLRVLAVTFDNGYIPPGCFDNIAGVCGQLGVDSLVVSVAKEKMDEAFQAGLKAQGSVCDPCFRALTARGTELAVERKIPVVMTGLSRGQICATKLHNLISNGVTDPDEIETYLRMFRESYHA